jgi:hypothetical protein
MSASNAIIRILCITCLSLFAALASAQERPGYGTAIDLAGAKKIVAGALAECQKNNWRVAASVVDNHGVLVYYENSTTRRLPARKSRSTKPRQPPCIDVQHERLWMRSQKAARQS